MSTPDPISTRRDLAGLLDVPPQLFLDVAADPNEWYGRIEVPKSNGDVRLLRPPRKALRNAQRRLLQACYDRCQIPKWLHGGIPNRSIITHARIHLGREMVATLDIKDFYPSTSSDMVRPVLNRLGFQGDALESALVLCLLDSCLPQGSPTSGLLANLAFVRGDHELRKMCRGRRLHYSRYVDDIAVSGDGDFADLKGPFIGCIRLAGYSVAKHKVHFRKRSQRQVVTGLVVNEKLRPTKAFIHEVKVNIRMCLEHGAAVVAASEGLSVQALKVRLNGQVNHVAQCDGALGRKLRGMLAGVPWRE